MADKRTDEEMIDTFGTSITWHGEWRHDADREICTLRARCEAYKGQVEAGAKEIERLREALKECADDLESLVKAEYAPMLDYPDKRRKYKRDLEPVIRARELLGNQQQAQQEK